MLSLHTNWEGRLLNQAAGGEWEVGGSQDVGRKGRHHISSVTLGDGLALNLLRKDILFVDTPTMRSGSNCF